MNTKQISALRDQLLIVQTALGAALDILFADGDPGCEHRQKDVLTTMGSGEHWICKECGFEYKEDDQ